MHVKCYCNGENRKINIAGSFSFMLEVCPFADTCIVSIFALQLLNIVVYISIYDISMAYRHAIFSFLKYIG